MTIDRLSALDRLMLWASRRWPQDIGVLAILDGHPLYDEVGRLRIDAVREGIKGRLHLVPRFRQLILVPRRGLGGPVWVDAPSFDVCHHVRVLPLEQPAGEDELIAAVERILGQRLDPGRPLWEMWLLPGLPGRQVGLFVRIHHAVADGMAAMAALASLLEPSPDMAPVAAPVWAPAPWPSRPALFADNLTRRLHGIARGLAVLARPRAALRGMLAAWPAIREVIAEEPATKTSLDRTVGQGRSLALVRTSLARVKEVGRAQDATVNDVLLAATAAGLRALLQNRAEPVEETTIRVYVPVSLRRHLRGRQQGNLIAQMVVPLSLGQADPPRRLAGIAAETRRRKARVRTSLSNLMVGGAVGRRVMLLAVMRQRVNATSASIPGPTEPLYLAGARISEAFSLLPLVANEPLGVGALSYAGALTIGIVADRDAYPDLDVLVGAVARELEALGVSIHPADEPVGATAASSPPPTSSVPAVQPVRARGGRPMDVRSSSPSGCTAAPPRATLPYGPVMSRLLRPLQRAFLVVDRGFMAPMFRAGLGWMIGSPLTGNIMVLRTRGRRSGHVREAPLGYVIRGGAAYCVAGYGSTTPWFRNLIADPAVEVVLPTRRFRGLAVPVDDPSQWLTMYRTLIASFGLVGRAVVGDVSRLGDAELLARHRSLPIVRIRPVEGEPHLVAGAFDPGGRGWFLSYGLWLLAIVLVVRAVARRSGIWLAMSNASRATPSFGDRRTA